MTQSIIYVLEIIQIQIKQRSRLLSLLSLINNSRKVPLAAHTVQKPRQIIRIGLLLNPVLVILLLSHIVDCIQRHPAAIHPAYLTVVDLKPPAAVIIIIIHDIAHVCLRFPDNAIKLGIHLIIREKFVHLLILKQHFMFGMIAYTNRTAHMLQYLLKGCKGGKQRILLSPLIKDILKNSYCIT